MLRAVICLLLFLGMVPVSVRADDQTTYSFGEPAKAAEATRTVTILALPDMRFDPDSLTIKHGEVITFVVTNKDKVLHELDIGDKPALRQHQKMMLQMSGAQHGDSATSVMVRPGETKSLTWRFNKTPDSPIELACLVAGHYQAGMKIEVDWAE
ncbi:MAG: cupredoxin domain-containing protein [Alphaproteobacteria bacterium]|nr:cupredoxin domain-containing protein [Alphaproteobacteria bacterium]